MLNRKFIIIIEDEPLINKIGKQSMKEIIWLGDTYEEIKSYPVNAKPGYRL